MGREKTNLTWPTVWRPLPLVLWTPMFLLLPPHWSTPIASNFTPPPDDIVMVWPSQSVTPPRLLGYINHLPVISVKLHRPAPTPIDDVVFGAVLVNSACYCSPTILLPPAAASFFPHVIHVIIFKIGVPGPTFPALTHPSTTNHRTRFFPLQAFGGRGRSGPPRFEDPIAPPPTHRQSFSENFDGKKRRELLFWFSRQPNRPPNSNL